MPFFKYIIAINKADWQDYCGFLSYLRKYTAKKYTAVRIYRSFSIFKKSEHPPVAYDMKYNPSKQESSNTIKGPKNGLKIIPADVFPIYPNDWAETLVQNYENFIPYDYHYGIAILKSIQKLFLPGFALLFLLLYPSIISILYPAYNFFHEPIYYILLIIDLICAVIILCTEILKYLVDFLHLKGLKKSIQANSQYTPPVSFQYLVPIKNALTLFEICPHIITLLCCYVFCLIKL